MAKLQFLLSLRDKLSGLPEADVEEHLSFYSEMIEDRIEEGLSEEDAISAIGSVDEIAGQIIADSSVSVTSKERANPKRLLKAWAILLLVLGSPVWFSLLIAAFAAVLSLYVSLWSVIISLWAVFVSVTACAFCGIIVGIGFALGGSRLTGIATTGSGLICAGLSVFVFYVCRAATRGTLLLTEKIALRIKNRFSKKEAAE